jgi:amidase
VKGALATAGIRSTGGATELRDHVPTVDAAVVDTVRRGGAVVFGKTNIPRWSGDHQATTSCSAPASPWDHERTPGGSSGGPARGHQ